MASNNDIEKLLNPKVFGASATLSQVVEGSLAPVGGGSAGGHSQQLAQQLETLTQAETQTAEANAQGANYAASQSPQGPGSGSIVSQAGSAIEDVLEGGLSPLITGILGLFSGGGSAGGASVPAPFLMPPSVGVNAGINEGAPTQPFGVDYAAGGAPRASGSGSGSGGAGGSQITVQVQAMDSQSFLDRSDDIAQAVRQAMLTSNVLSDVIREV
jgi:hypothetical protein